MAPYLHVQTPPSSPSTSVLAERAAEEKGITDDQNRVAAVFQAQQLAEFR